MGAEARVGGWRWKCSVGGGEETLVGFVACMVSRPLADHTATSSTPRILHLPNSVRIGFVSVSIAGSRVHGRMYTHSKRPFSSGESEPCGTLAYDHVGRYGRLRFSHHQQ